MNEQAAVFTLERIYLKDFSFESPNPPRSFQTTESPIVDVAVQTTSTPAEGMEDVTEVVVTVAVHAEVGGRRSELFCRGNPAGGTIRHEKYPGREFAFSSPGPLPEHSLSLCPGGRRGYGDSGGGSAPASASRQFSKPGVPAGGCAIGSVGPFTQVAARWKNGADDPCPTNSVEAAITMAGKTQVHQKIGLPGYPEPQSVGVKRLWGDFFFTNKIPRRAISSGD